MKIINLTPHDIHIVDNAGNVVRTYPASGEVARIKMTTEQAGVLPDGTPLSKTEFDPSTIEGLPAPQDNTRYIVSVLLKNACPDRSDLLVPAEQVRDEKGRIVGCRSLGV